MSDSHLLQTASALGGERLRNSWGRATERRLAAGLRVSGPGGLYPGRVHGWRRARGVGRRRDLSDDAEGLRQGRVFAEHFFPALPLLR